MFLLHPVFCYEANFPVSKEPLNWTFLFEKMLFVAGCLFTIAIHFNDWWVPLHDAMRDGT